jgi:hypothetical protein
VLVLCCMRDVGMRLQACKEEGVAEAHIWGTGLVVRTPGAKSDLYCIADLSKPKVTKLAPSGLLNPPTAMAVIPPKFTAHGGPEVGRCSLSAACVGRRFTSYFVRLGCAGAAGHRQRQHYCGG